LPVILMAISVAFLAYRYPSEKEFEGSVQTFSHFVM
jgi:hypothetical protein